MEEVVSAVIEVPLWKGALLHAGQRLVGSTSSWYAEIFEDGEEHAAKGDGQKSSLSKHMQALNRHPPRSQESSSDRSETAHAQTS